MKRYLAILFVLTACCVLFTACGGTAAKTSEPASAPAPTEAPKPTDAPAPTEAPRQAEAPTEEPKPTEAPEPTEAPAADADSAALPDGVYQVDFDTDSSMFHVNEALNGKGVLTVKDGQMTVHVTLASKKIVNLFAGSAADAKASDTHLEPTVDTVTYDDGMTDEVYGFDIPVPAIGEEFPCALVGTKGTWYDHMVSVSNPVPMDEAG